MPPERPGGTIREPLPPEAGLAGLEKIYVETLALGLSDWPPGDDGMSPALTLARSFPGGSAVDVGKGDEQEEPGRLVPHPTADPRARSPPSTR